MATETETKERADWGEAAAKVTAWCNTYTSEHSKQPKWSEVVAGLKDTVTSASINRGWTNWRDAQKKAKEGGPAPVTAPAKAAVVPEALTAGIAAVWASVLTELQTDLETRIDAVRSAAHGEIEMFKQDSEDLRERNEFLDSLMEEEQSAHEIALGAADDRLKAATAVVAERDKALEAVKAELALVQKDLEVRGAELKAAAVATEKLEKALAKADDDEAKLRGVIAGIESNLTEAKVVNTHQADELVAARKAQTTAEQTVIDREAKLETLQGKLESARQDLAGKGAELAGLTSTVSGLQEQLLKAEARADRERDRCEAVSNEARQRAAELEQELAELKRSGKDAKA
jgi:chromosome segregation ATPase